MKIKNIFLAILSGFLLILSFPNFFSLSLSKWPGFMAWIALIPLFCANYNKDFKDSFKLGFICGFVFFAGTLYWITFIKEMGSLAYLSWILLSLYLGLYVGVFCSLLSFTNLLFAPFLWVTFEFARAHFLSGFPWVLIGYSQFGNIPLIQISSFTGVYGISFLVVLINAGIAYFFLNVFKGSRVFLVLTVTIIIFIICYAYGLMMIAGYVTKDEYEKSSKLAEDIDRRIKVSVLQGNIEQDQKWSEEYADKTFNIYEGLTKEASKDSPELIIWPETAAPIYLKYDKKNFKKVKKIVESGNTYSLIGAPDAFIDKDYNIKESFNSAFLVSKEGRILSKYDKIHLVPFGEYVPYKDVFPFIQKLTKGTSDFSSGGMYTVFNGPDKFSVLICWEVIFPEPARKFVKNGANFLVTISNDAWYRKSAAPYQHFITLPFRAVENKVNIIRAANTGVSGFVDYKGEILDYLDIFKKGKLTSSIVMRNEVTFYNKFGDWFVKICAIIAAIGVIFIKKYRE
ncbi:MAG: apolipoprotein N-acyltransferase [Candidatus Firestonebacteria bacterium]